MRNGHIISLSYNQNQSQPNNNNHHPTMDHAEPTTSETTSPQNRNHAVVLAQTDTTAAPSSDMPSTQAAAVKETRAMSAPATAATGLSMAMTNANGNDGVADVGATGSGVEVEEGRSTAAVTATTATAVGVGNAVLTMAPCGATAFAPESMVAPAAAPVPATATDVAVNAMDATNTNTATSDPALTIQVYTCDVCKVAMFPTLHEAEIHEQGCSAVADASGGNTAAAAAAAAGGDSKIATTTNNVAMAPAGNGAGNGASNHPSNPALQRPPSFEIDANLELLHGIVDDHDVGVGHFDDDMPDAHAAHVALTDPHLLASLDGVGGDVVCVDGVGDHGEHGGLGGHQQQQELAATSSAHDVAIAPSMTTVAQSQTTIQPSTSTTTKYPPSTPPTATIPTIPTMPTTTTTTTTLPPTPLMTENNRQRSILTQTYSPYISPTDTSLPHARHRLQTALEQTRIMRAAFTENAYDKYRVRLKSVPNSVDEIIHGIVVDPQERGRVLRERAEIMRVEKEREKREAREESLLQQFSNASGGVGGLNGMGAGGGGGGGGGRDGRDGDFDQLSFFGSGLSLVILPEEDADEREVDVNRYPHGGPTDPVTGQRYEGISAAAAAAAELVFDRVRRSHAIRMERDRRITYEVDSGAGGVGVGGGAVNSYGQSHLLPLNEAAAAAAKPLARSNSKNSQNFRLAESGSNFEADLRKSTGVISPALSNDSNAGNVRQRSSSSKQSIQNLLSLSPEAESTRPDGKLTAVQAALISCGVGANEMRTDGRLKSLQHHQRIPPIDSTAFGMSSSSSLPPLLGARQISRLQPVEVREQEQQQQQQGEGESSSARGAIQTVVDQIICTPTSEFSNIDSKGKSQKQDDSSLDAGFEEGNAVAETNENSGGGGNGSSLVAFSSEHCTSEIAFMRRMRSLELQNLSDYQKASNNVAQSKEEATPIENVQSSVPYIDPVLAFSVMSAVGLIHERVDKGATENEDAEFLGLNSLTRLENVSRFFKSNASHGRKRRFIDAFVQPVTSDGTTTNGDAKSANLDFSSSLNGNSESCPEETVYHIRGGGGDDALNDNEKPSKVTSKTGVSGIQTDKVISANATRPTRDPSQPTSMPLFRSPVDTSNMDSLHSAASQGPFGGNQLPYNSNNQKGQGVATSFGTQIDGKNASLNTAASRQLLQHHLGIHHDPYATAALARQLGLPMGSLPPNNFNQSHLNSISASDLSEYYIRSRLLGAPDWTSLGNTNPSNADILSQHPQLAAAIGLIPGQLNLSMRDQEAARTMLLREQHNMATARAQEAAAAAACYQAALSSISPQNPFGFMGQQISQTSRNSFSGSSPSPSLSHLRSNLPPSNSSLLASTQASAMNELHKKQAGPKKQQRKRSTSLTAMKKTPAVEASNATKDTPTDSIMQDAQVKNSQSNSLDPSPLDEANKMQDVPVSQCPSIERLASAPSSSVISTLPSAMLKGDEPISELKLTTKVVADEGVADKIEKSELVPKEHEVAKIPQKNVTTSEKVKPRIMDEKSSSYFQSFPSCLLFNAPKRPKELHDEIADLIAGAKFHKAYLLSKQKSYGTDDLLVEFLTSLGAAVPIPKAMIANLLTESLSTSQYKERMRAFVGYNSSASAARDVSCSFSLSGLNIYVCFICSFSMSILA